MSCHYSAIIMENSGSSKVWEHPDEQTLQLMKAILRLSRNDSMKEVPPWTKKKIHDKYELLSRAGEEFVLHKLTNKPLLPSFRFEEVLQEHHDKACHPGCDNTYRSIKDQYHSIPQSIVRDYCRKCAICQGKRPQKKLVLGKAIVAKGTNYNSKSENYYFGFHSVLFTF